MKKSRRYIAGTLLCLYAGIFVSTGINRATENMVTLPEELVTRTPPAELQTLTDFNSISTRGDFILEIVREPGYSVDYTPPADGRGNFEARVEDGELILTGFNNRRDSQGGRVRIGMPVLTSLSSMFNPEVHISGYNQGTLRLDLTNHREVSLDSNTLDSLEIEASFVRDISLAGTTANTEQLDIDGQTTITH